MTIYTVLLEDETTGTLVSSLGGDELVGKRMPISVQNENGGPVTKTGKIVEILTSKEEWE